MFIYIESMFLFLIVEIDLWFYYDTDKYDSKLNWVVGTTNQLSCLLCFYALWNYLSLESKTHFLCVGGHLRYQLYIWLEREVEALRRLCGYASASGAPTGGELICADQDPPPLPEKPTLHQLLVREKADFEAKVQRAVRRKKWLKGE